MMPYTQPNIQCFRQIAPLRESHATFRGGPQKNLERANLALYFYKAACRLNPGIVFYKPSQGSKLQRIWSPMN